MNMTVELDKIRRRCETQIASNDQSSWFQTAHADRCRLLKLVDELSVRVDELTDRCRYHEGTK